MDIHTIPETKSKLFMDIVTKISVKPHKTIATQVKKPHSFRAYMEYTMETTYKTHMIVLYQAHMTFCFNPVFRFENQNATNATIDIIRNIISVTTTLYPII